MNKVLTTGQEYIDSIMSNFSLWRLDVVASIGFLIATVFMVILSHKILKLVKSQSQNGFTFGIRGIVVASWMLALSALWTVLLTPYGISFDMAVGAILTWLALLALLLLIVLSPFIITFGVFAVLVFPFLRVKKKEQQRLRNNVAKGVIQNRITD